MFRAFSRTAMCSLLGAASIGLACSSARADVILEDPLHGFCNGAAPAGSCADNGTNTPLGNSTTFGFSISPGPQTGNLSLYILVPNNDPLLTLPFSITGIHGGTNNLGA